MTTQLKDDTERDQWKRRAPLTRVEKLEEIRKMRAELRGEAQKESKRE
jgi:hypothetical protein